MPNAAVEISTQGDNTVIAAPGEGKSIHVLAYTLIAASAVSVKFKDAADNEYTGDMPFGANGGVATAAPMFEAYFQLPENTALEIELSAGVAIGGHIHYTLKGKNGF